MRSIALRDYDFTLVNGKPKMKYEKLSIVIIIKNGCYYCDLFKPIYEDLAKQIGSVVPIYTIEAADIAKKNGLSSALNFRGYPTVKFYNNGLEIGEYNGERNVKAIMSEICNVYHKFHNLKYCKN